MKRILCVLLTMVVVFSIILTGIGCKEEAVSAGEVKEATVNDNEDSEELAEESVIEEEKVTIVYTSWRTEDIERVNKMNSVFMEKNPNIIIDFQPIKSTEYDAQIKSALEAGVGADLLMMNSYDGGRFYYNSDFLYELNEDVPLLEEYSPVVLDAFSTEEGVIYSVPLIAVSHGIYYNKEIFDKYDLAEPTTWKEFLDVSKTLKENGETAISQGSRDPWTLYEVFFSGLGPNFYGGEENRKKLVDGDLKMTDEPFVKAFEAMLELVPYFPNGFEALDYVGMQQLFITGQAGMFIGGSWEIGVFEDMEAEFEIGWFAPPVVNSGDVIQYCFQTDAGIGMNRNTKHLKETLEYLNWLASPEYAELQMNEQPGFFALAPGEYALTNELAQKMLDVVEDADLTIRTTWEKLSAQEPSGNMLMWDATANLVNGVFTPFEAAEYVQENLETWYEPFMK